MKQQVSASVLGGCWMVLVTLLVSESPMRAAENGGSGRRVLTLESAAAVLTLDLDGGALGDFHLKSTGINPFNWGTPGAGDTRVRGFGHFLCLDRWGPASAAESANGMPYHGEASNVRWQLDATAHADSDTQAGIMSATLPMAGLHIVRKVQLAQSGTIALVRETVSNQNKLGRVYNWVQHPTVGPPFLDAHTVVDCNGRRGFAQGNPMPTPEEPSFYWPQALSHEGASVNLRFLQADPNPNVVSYAIDEDQGWVTAASPTTGLLVGYVWSTRDYPWVSLWRDVRDGKPSARGLEFGTTGLHQPFPILVKKGSIFGRPVLEHLDAGEKATRSYAVFLSPIPKDYAGVETLRLDEGKLTIQERGRGEDRKIVIQAGPGFGFSIR